MIKGKNCKIFPEEFLKYLTGNKIDGIGILPDKQEIKMKYDEFKFPLGSLIIDFNKHLRKPFWKKKYNHDLVTEIYERILNGITIVKGF